MEQNEENQTQTSQELFFKYLIESIQKQQEQFHHKSIDYSHPVKLLPFGSYLSSENYLNSNENTPSKKSNTIDDVYWERRRKNNEAAKRSRDARRAKEDEIAMRAALLEQENMKLRLENAQLKQENLQLRCQIYSSTTK